MLQGQRVEVASAFTRSRTPGSLERRGILARVQLGLAREPHDKSLVLLAAVGAAVLVGRPCESVGLVSLERLGEARVSKRGRSQGRIRWEFIYPSKPPTIRPFAADLELAAMH